MLCWLQSSVAHAKYDRHAESFERGSRVSKESRRYVQPNDDVTRERIQTARTAHRKHFVLCVAGVLFCLVGHSFVHSTCCAAWCKEGCICSTASRNASGRCAERYGAVSSRHDAAHWNAADSRLWSAEILLKELNEKIIIIIIQIEITPEFVFLFSIAIEPVHRPFDLRMVSICSANFPFCEMAMATCFRFSCSSSTFRFKNASVSFAS